jgi:hypothetical protein
MSEGYTERVYGSQEQTKRRDSERGVALILALMLLLFLSILGGALLMTTTLDIRVGSNFQSNEEAIYVAEAGIENAREVLRQAGTGLSAVLTRSAGPDGTLTAASDFPTLLSSDDLPLIPSAAAQRAAGAVLSDASGAPAGNYWAWIRNDVADGTSMTVDTNQILNVLAVGVVGNARKTVEATVRKGRFPTVPAALTLDGPVALFRPPGTVAFALSGIDAGGNRSVDSVALTSAADVNTVSDAIPASWTMNYRGLNSLIPDVQDASGTMDQSLRSAAALEGVVASMSANATDVFDPPYGTVQSIQSLGSAADYRVAVINGDCALGPGTGYGILLCRGELSVVSNFAWNGLIVVIGQGVMRWTVPASGTVSGAVVLARTRAADRSAANSLGSLLMARGPVSADFSAAMGAGIQYNSATIANANRIFPFTLMSFKEY